MSVQSSLTNIQHTLFDAKKYVNKLSVQTEDKKRIHYDEPKWEKFYSVYACDFTKYNAICKAITDNDFVKIKQNYPEINIETIKSYTRKDFDKVKLMCYVKDEAGNKIHLGDQKHIYRFKTLNNLKTLLVKYMTSRPALFHNSVKIPFHNFTYYQELYEEAKDPKDRIIEEIEFEWLEDFTIKQKINIYIKTLRLCKTGISLENAVNIVKKCPG